MRKVPAKALHHRDSLKNQLRSSMLRLETDRTALLQTWEIKFICPEVLSTLGPGEGVFMDDADRGRPVK